MKFLSILVFCSIVCISSSDSIASIPRVSIITSMYKGDFFIKEFLEDITQQTIFDQCELILINAYSPGKEDKIIREYVKKYSNIVYIKLAEDPGLYAVWNLGIKCAQAPYITNANIDDRLRHDCYELYANYLDTHPDIDLVYSGCYVTRRPNEIFEKNSSGGEVVPASVVDFSTFGMWVDHLSFPNNHPMWRKSMHVKYGLFDETYASVGDFEMWLRAAFVGKAKFARLPEILGLYYLNPEGISTKTISLERDQDCSRLDETYRDVPERCFDHIRFLEEYN